MCGPSSLWNEKLRLFLVEKILKSVLFHNVHFPVNFLETPHMHQINAPYTWISEVLCVSPPSPRRSDLPSDTSNLTHPKQSPGIFTSVQFRKEWNNLSLPNSDSSLCFLLPVVVCCVKKSHWPNLNTLNLSTSSLLSAMTLWRSLTISCWICPIASYLPALYTPWLG